MTAKPLYTLDIETDPFQQGRYPLPFSIDLFDGSEHCTFWGADCMGKMWQHIQGREPGLIYAHNGGRFDFFYCMEWIAGQPMRVINSRIIQAHMQVVDGIMEFRDSYAIMPFALAAYQGGGKTKLEIDMKKLEYPEREYHRDEIIRYLHMDTETLFELVSAFIGIYGPRLTIGGTAMKELQKIHEFSVLDGNSDFQIRGGMLRCHGERKFFPGYYYGGRVQCFEQGILHGDFKVFDVNSMYPYVMKAMQHPVGMWHGEGTVVRSDTALISAEGTSYAALPCRMENDSLDFAKKTGIFHMTRHEWDAALELNLFKPKRILRCLNFSQWGTFAGFVDKFYEGKVNAKISGDAIMELFYKFILNSAYGKFSQNPDKYKEQIICLAGESHAPQPICLCDGWPCVKGCHGWRMAEEFNPDATLTPQYWIWERNSYDVTRFNVAVGASITGAARAVLMQAIAKSTRPVYCDTDSLICTHLDIPADAKALGAWKLEASATVAAIAGKKLYALFSCDSRQVENSLAELTKKRQAIEWVKIDGQEMLCVKKANKGVVVTAEEIVRIAQGEVVESHRQAPSFKLNGGHNFITRRVRMT